MLDDIWAQTALKLSSELNEVWFWSNFELQDWKTSALWCLFLNSK